MKPMTGEPIPPNYAKGPILELIETALELHARKITPIEFMKAIDRFQEASKAEDYYNLANILTQHLI